MTPQAPDPYAASGTKTRNAVVAAVVGALLVGALAGVFGARLLARTASVPGGETLAVRERGPAPVLQRTAAVPALPPTLDRTRKTMPADVRAWLEHLERIERKRGELSRQGVAKILVMSSAIQGGGAELQALKGFADAASDPDAPDPKSPAQGVGETAEEMQAAWAALQREYDAAAPPAACRPLANGYRNALRETGAMIGDLTAAIAGASADPQAAVAKLEGMKGSSARIDGYGKASDAELGRICDEYETRKWFSVAGDFGGGGILDKF